MGGRKGVGDHFTAFVWEEEFFDGMCFGCLPGSRASHKMCMFVQAYFPCEPSIPGTYKVKGRESESADKSL